MQAVAAVQPRTIVVFINGGVISSPWIAANIPASLSAGYGGELGGDAIVDVLEGSYTPGGKLPATIYQPNFTATRDSRDVDLASGDGITYQYFTGTPLYPFGWGLSYTAFAYAWANSTAGTAPVVRVSLDELAAAYRAEPEPVRAAATSTERGLWSPMQGWEVAVSNTGNVTGDAVVLAFVASPTGNVTDGPLVSLFGFTRLHDMAPGETRNYTFSPPPPALLARFDERGQAWLAAGASYSIRIGDVQAPVVGRLEVTPGAVHRERLLLDAHEGVAAAMAGVAAAAAAK